MLDQVIHKLWFSTECDLNVSFTPAAFEEPSTYLDTAIMETMKKIMDAVTHLMKSFKRKERNTTIQATNQS